MGRNPGIDMPLDKNHRNSKESLQKAEKAKAHHAAYLGSHYEFTWTSRFNDIATAPPRSAGPTIGNLTCFLGEAVLLEELVQLSLPNSETIGYRGTKFDALAALASLPA